MRQKIELLAPAKNLQVLKIAVHYGADAFYVGLKDFNLRINSGNFSFEELQEAISLAKKHSKKIYLALNTYPLESQLSDLKEQIRRIAELDLDGVIAADIGVIKLLAENTSFPLIVSTQANVVNSETIKALYEHYNIKRVILARELSLPQIEMIRRAIPAEVELEIFGHGAMCMAISGRCLLSYYFTNRASNQGDCPQVCRWEFALLERTRPNQVWQLYEQDGYTYFLNSKDLYTLDILDKIMAAGIDALKIEGRNKSEFYVAIVSGVYSYALSNLAEGRDIPEYFASLLALTPNRGFTHGFYIPGEENKSISYSQLKAPNTARYLGFYGDDGYFSCKNKIELGMKINILTPDMQFFENREVMRIYELDIEENQPAHNPRNIANSVAYTQVGKKYILEIKDIVEVPKWSIVFGLQPYH